MSYRPRLAAKLPLVAAECAIAALLTTPLAMAQSEAAPSTLQAQRVVIDAVTGKVRAPEPGEWSKAPTGAQRSAARSATGAAATGVETHPAMQRLQSAPLSVRMGAVGRRIDTSKLSFSVARRDASGAVSTQCLTGDEAANTALNNEAQGERHDQ